MVIAYHEIVPTHARYIYSVSCSGFEEHVSAIQSALAECPPHTQPVQITFDDGHFSQYAHALPVLQKYNVKAAFCITAGWTDREPAYMNRSHLRELLALGHRIHAHGWSHRMLTHCSPSALRVELQWAKHTLEDILGTGIEGISIPHGRWSDRVLESCAHWGYKDVYVSDPGIGRLKRSGVRLTGRLMVTRNMSGDSLLQRVQRTAPYSKLEQIRRIATRGAKLALGDKRYRQVWKYLGNKEQELPSVAAPKQAIAVLQLISSGGFYGAESMLINLAKTISQDGVRAIIGVFKNSQNPHVEIADRAIKSGLQAETIACGGRLDWRAVSEIRRLAYKHGIDIIHTHGSKAAFYGRVAGIGLGLPLVATYHNSSPGAGIPLRIYHVLDRLVLRGFDRIVAVSESIKHSLRASGIDRRKIAVIENGLDLDAFINSGFERRQRAGDTTCVSVGIVGRLIPLKGHRFLLQAAPGILRQFPNVSFVFVGDGPELPNLQRMVGALNLENHVIFTGKQEDMPRVYRSLDILVSSSLHEGMPMTLLEGLASGCAVVATAVGDVPKLIKHGETGLLVQPGDSGALKESVLRLLSGDGTRSALAMQGQHWIAAHFSSVQMAARYQEVYACLSDPESAEKSLSRGHS